MYTLILNSTLVDFVSKQQRIFSLCVLQFLQLSGSVLHTICAHYHTKDKPELQYHNIVFIFMIGYAIVYLTYNFISIFSCLLFILYTKLNIGFLIIINLHFDEKRKPYFHNSL